MKRALAKAVKLLRVGVLNRFAFRRIAASDHPKAPALSEVLRRVNEGGTMASDVRQRLEDRRAALLADTSILGEATDGQGAQTVAYVTDAGSRGAIWCQQLYELVYRLEATNCLELGSCVGMSGAYLCAALDALDQSGRLITMEGDAARADKSKETFETLGYPHCVEVIPGLFQDTLPTVLANHPPFDFAFIDGHHDEEATWHYYEMISEQAACGATLVFDDIRWSEGMWRVWQRIAGDERISVAVDQGRSGVCLLATGSESKRVRATVTVPTWKQT